jgi:polyisoprenyl-phosphate glycosyltransferase
MKKELFSIVVPVYFNALNLPFTVERFSKLAAKMDYVDFEFVFVDDGSGDNSYEVLTSLKKKDDRIVIIKLARNFGSFNAILAGLKQAKGHVVGVIAADLQDPPEMFEEMYALHKKGKKLIMGTRSTRDDPWLSVLFTKVFYSLFRKFAMKTMPVGGFDFVLIDRKVVDVVNIMEEKNSNVLVQMLWLGFPSVSLPYHRSKRELGVSMWTMSKKIKLFVDMFVGFSYAPVRFISSAGIVLAFLSIIYTLIIIYIKFFTGGKLEGWSSLAAMIAFLAAFQFLGIGILGEYMWRILDEVRRRPNYIIEETKE